MIDEGFGVLIFAVMIFIGGCTLGVEKIAKDYEDFTKDHNKTPYCIEREIGHEKIKKCYIATEVKE